MSRGTGRQRLRCNEGLAPGRAFPIEDALIATRWAALIRPRGYRVAITPEYRDAEEIIEVYIPKAKAPTFRVRRTARSILVTDCIGLPSSFPTLADALLAMAPLPKSGEREMLKGARPAWLPEFPARPPRRTDNVWSRVRRSVLETARNWALRG